MEIIHKNIDEFKSRLETYLYKMAFECIYDLPLTIIQSVILLCNVEIIRE